MAGCGTAAMAQWIMHCSNSKSEFLHNNFSKFKTYRDVSVDFRRNLRQSNVEMGKIWINGQIPHFIVISSIVLSGGGDI
jgi:hypothetical protein